MKREEKRIKQIEGNKAVITDVGVGRCGRRGEEEKKIKRKAKAKI